MHRKIFSSLLILAAACLTGRATTVEAGKLSSIVSDPVNVTSLTLEGTLNAADFKFMATEMAALRTLDMRGVTAIEACGDVFFANVNNHEANKIPNGTFAASGLESVTLPSFDGLVIGHAAFSGSALGAIDIPATVALVGDGAFSSCPSLASVKCLATDLGVNAFADCPSLATAVFGTEAVALPRGCFYNDAALVSLTGTVASVGERAMAGCASLESFPFTPSLVEIGKEAFAGAGLTEVDLTKCTSLRSVGDWAFAVMPRVTAINTGDVATLGSAVAFSCPRLVSFTTSARATEIPDFALSKSAALDSVGILHDDIEHIGRYAMSGLGGIETITLPAGLASLGDHAMENMTGLRTINLNNETVPEVGDSVWAGVDQKSVDLLVPPSAVTDYSTADQWQNFNVVNRESTSSSAVVDEISDLRARFDGDNLIVEALGVDIASLSLYDPAGHLLVSVAAPGEFTVIDTAGFATRLYIVHAALADGRAAALKLAKH